MDQYCWVSHPKIKYVVVDSTDGNPLQGSMSLNSMLSLTLTAAKVNIPGLLVVKKVGILYYNLPDFLVAV